MIFRFFSLSPSLVRKFFRDWSLVLFSSSVSYWVKRFFTSNITIWNLSAFLLGQDIHSGLLVFLSSLLHHLGDFPLSSYSLFQQFPCSAEFPSEKRANCNNMTPGAESSQSRSHMTAIIQNFTLVSLTSTITPYPATVSCHPTHLTIYLTFHYLCSRKVFSAVRTINITSTYWGIRLHFLSSTGWHRIWVVGWTQSNTLLSCKVVSLVIGISQDYWLDDEGLPLECHWLDDKGPSLEYHWLDDKSLIPTSYHYARVVARWLDVLASYAG